MTDVAWLMSGNGADFADIELHPQKPSAPFTAATVEPCSLTRSELHELLKESQYG
eukprot:CAMPEP_0174855744 /NCGR_PEP_ID=MMETSP1114-20130205/34116_1 /TAXON_ID=312471 /ORGANISM="Neobodo designis, Strain CCAP 1951/1" /LENGTH=54 /DNA_ID=CAMNT_0016090505 /DNA_START=49 /DNA_END=209 /DNA_ORIENTATION=+